MFDVDGEHDVKTNNGSPSNAWELCKLTPKCIKNKGMKGEGEGKGEKGERREGEARREDVER